MDTVMCNRCGAVVARQMLRNHLDLHRATMFPSPQLSYAPFPNTMPQYSKQANQPRFTYHAVPPPVVYQSSSVSKTNQKRRARETARASKRVKENEEKILVKNSGGSTDGQQDDEFPPMDDTFVATVDPVKDQPIVPASSSNETEGSSVCVRSVPVKNKYNDFCKDHPNASSCFVCDCITMQQYVSSICDWRHTIRKYFHIGAGEFPTFLILTLTFKKSKLYPVTTPHQMLKSRDRIQHQ